MPRQHGVTPLRAYVSRNEQRYAMSLRAILPLNAALTAPHEGAVMPRRRTPRRCAAARAPPMRATTRVFARLLPCRHYYYAIFFACHDATAASYLPHFAMRANMPASFRHATPLIRCRDAARLAADITPLSPDAAIWLARLRAAPYAFQRC
jgi:hypothetical protein